MQHIHQIQCMTISPLKLEEEKSKEGIDGDLDMEEEESGSEGNNTSDTFLTLQLYARHCFAPTIQAMSVEKNDDGDAIGTVAAGSDVLSNLQTKIRELDLTLSRARQSTLHSIPQVFL